MESIRLPRSYLIHGKYLAYPSPTWSDPPRKDGAGCAQGECVLPRPSSVVIIGSHAYDSLRLRKLAYTHCCEWNPILQTIYPSNVQSIQKAKRKSVHFACRLPRTIHHELLIDQSVSGFSRYLKRFTRRRRPFTIYSGKESFVVSEKWLNVIIKERELTRLPIMISPGRLSWQKPPGQFKRLRLRLVEVRKERESNKSILSIDFKSLWIGRSLPRY